MNLEGTKTKKNLETAFAGESMARNKYTYYASVAQAEGYNVIADIFEETAFNEMAHAKMYFELLNEGIPNTLENLKEAAAGENFEHTTMYKEFAEEARAEGFERIAYIFEQVGKIEENHEDRFNSLYRNLQNDNLYNRSSSMLWKCQVCGYIHEGESAPKICPVCRMPQGVFELYCKRF